MKDVILYHGSRGGIIGNIAPISREICDFGKGFYMGTNQAQAQSLVIDDIKPVFYKVKFKLSEIPESKILVLDNEEWLRAVLACRKNVPEFSKTKTAKNIIKNLKNYDVIIGSIADDRMKEAIDSFREFSLTDAGLYACLRSIDYGKQYVAKTEFACSKIEILAERELYGKEAQLIQQYSQSKRAESRGVVKSMKIEYQRKGKYLNEMIHDIKEQEKNSPKRGDDNG